MQRERIRIFDTTLRDGEQSPGCSMNLKEKRRMARQLERIAGFTRLEMGATLSGVAFYKAKGYTLDYLGTEDVDGTEAHKLRVTRHRNSWGWRCER